ncbi:HNH endonuclease [Streptomyces sp. NPDC101455]|uniref:HNH endonuclease n=1 Tax=Streptomyces sp. NPDC101455 TaxID=3366142 RepID=UPI0037FB8AEF
MTPDLRLIYGCPKWCVEDHAEQAVGDRERHGGAEKALRLPDGELVMAARLALEPGRKLPQLVISRSPGLVAEGVQLLDRPTAMEFSNDVQRFASHVQRMVETVRIAEARLPAPRRRKPKKRPLPPEMQHCWPETRLYLAERDGLHCFYCGTAFETARHATVDHYVPRALWSCNLPANLVLACQPCNEAKADRLTWSMVAVLLAWHREQLAANVPDRHGVPGVVCQLGTSGREAAEGAGNGDSGGVQGPPARASLASLTG